MTSNPPDSLQRLLDEGPFVRLLAQTLLAEEADEVVQQTWLAAVRHGGEGVAEPRSWLARIARNVAINLRRGRRRRDRQERDGAAAALVPSSADLLAREEQRRLLVAAVDRLPAPLRTVVLLRYFDGLPPRRIAGQLGVPVATVWNRLRQGLQLLRERLDAEHGGQRRAWLLPLVPFATGTPGLPWAEPATTTGTFSTLGLGVIAMTMKTKLVAGLAVLLAASGALVLWATRDAVPGRGSPPQRAEQGSVAAADLPRDAVVAAANAKPDEPTQREAATAPAAAASPTGTLVVHVRHGDDKAPAEGVTMSIWRSGAYSRVDAVRRRTDAAGTVRFEELDAGRFGVSSDRGYLGKRADVRNGETTELDYELAVGLTLTGIVVDASAAPVAGALVEAAGLGEDADAEQMATAGPDGRFVVRSAPTRVAVGARAVGHGSSPMQHVRGKGGNTVDLRLQLGPAAGTVSGLVVDTQNRPVPDTIVSIGQGTASVTAVAGASSPPIPALVRTDAEGRFVAIGVPPGTQPVAARARELAPWLGTCEVTANVTTPLRIALVAGATIRGTVRDTGGAALAQVEIAIGPWDTFAHHRTATAGDGSFELRGLPAGEVLVTAKHDTAGRAEQRTPTAAGVVTPCDLQLSLGLQLKGRVVDEQGAPVAGAMVQCLATSGDKFLATSTGSAWFHNARTGPDGCFSAPNCPSGARMAVMVQMTGFAELSQKGIDPASGPLELQLKRLQPPSVRIRGIVVDPAGGPVPSVILWALGPARHQACTATTGADGRFELGPLEPGRWVVQARTPRFPPWTSGPNVLAADAVLDLGLVSMTAGGTATVSVEGDRSDVRFSILDAAGKTTTPLTDTGGTLVSSALVPGEYNLLVAAKSEAAQSVAAQSVPFTVRAGETTPVNVKLQPGIRQRFEVTAEGLASPPDSAVLAVHRGTTLIARTTASLRGDAPASEVCLLPGDYRVTATAGDRQLGTAAFTVGATEGPPVRLVLR